MSTSEHPYLKITAARYSQDALFPGLRIFRGLHGRRN
jgi:hypothetical protein